MNLRIGGGIANQICQKNPSHLASQIMSPGPASYHHEYCLNLQDQSSGLLITSGWAVVQGGDSWVYKGA